jgi:hypothetical protein
VATQSLPLALGTERGLVVNELLKGEFMSITTEELMK